MLSDSNKDNIGMAIGAIIDFSGQSLKEFKEDVSKVSEALQGKSLDKEHMYKPLQEAFLKPEKAFTNLEKQGKGEITVKEVQQYIVDFADAKINDKISELGIDKSEIAWNKENVSISSNGKNFVSVQKQNLNNMSQSQELRERNRAEAQQRNFNNSAIGMVANAITVAANAQGGERIRGIESRGNYSSSVKASSFHR